MSEYIPDPIERGESSAEDAYFDLMQPGGKMRCYQCEAIFEPESEGGTISPSPWAMPVCGRCLHAAMTEAKTTIAKLAE